MTQATLDSVLEALRRTPVIAIARRPKAPIAETIAAIAQGGVELIELTMDTPGAADALRELRASRPDVLLGAGTVTTRARAEQALRAGAAFFVTPNVDEGVIRLGREAGLAVFAGAMTPTEVWRAYAAGSSVVKIFPAGTLGPGYLRELRGPLSEVPLMAVGGVGAHNAAEFLRAGAVGIGVGSALSPASESEADLAAVTARARELVEVARGAAGEQG